LLRSFFVGYPLFWKSNYTGFVEALKKYELKDEVLFGLYGTIIYVAANAVSTIVFVAIHKFELPFFERYKAFNDQWPWYAEKVAWKE
jgi:hypothetical protein